MSSPQVVSIRGCRLELGRSGGREVVFGLDELKIGQGEQVAFTGPSGCGKSTLLNLVAGLRRPDQGEILIDDTDIGKLKAGRMDAFRGTTMGFVFQGFNLLDSFTALENVLIGIRFGRLKAAGGGRPRAAELLARVGLKDRMQSYPHQLSAGERQRVAIARAIASKPKLLLGDEPTGALDPATGHDVFGLISDICTGEGCALMFVTHDLELASLLPRRVDCRGMVGTVKSEEVAA
jgi:ABC-type lipoprotein export system ATPase subunit